ncbi:hypothetical protein OHA71_06605 [Streptomyces sp. NBC_00444]|uniref:hypothetical protein n=1 Tax=Streptomyces sp. NBC_00444 TaxID=2975744 RepID=UPI002E217640
MPDTPLTDQQLTDIEQRARAATSGPWEPYPDYGPYFHANTSGEYLRGVGDINFGVGEQAEADETFVRHARQDVDALLAYVARLQQQRKFLLDQLAKRDAESGRGDKALREFLTDPDTVPAEACGKCKQPFDDADARFDGKAQKAGTPYCRRCVDLCHDNEIADHRCVICA